MIKAEFGIIDDINKNKDYSDYEPQKYHCIAIDDNIYISDWWSKLELLKTYFHSLKRPSTGLSRWGVTLIPPESLAEFEEIVLSDKRINYDENLVSLANTIKKAINDKKFMIHYGV